MKYVKGSGDADVFVDGVKAQHVLEADDEAGEVLLAQTDYRTGELIKNSDNPHGYETILVKGKVEIQKKESTSSMPNPWEYPYSCCGCGGYEWDPSKGTYNPCFEHQMGVLGTEDGKVAMKIISKPAEYNTKDYRTYDDKPYFLVKYGGAIGKFVDVAAVLWLFGITKPTSDYLDRMPNVFPMVVINGHDPPIISHYEDSEWKKSYFNQENITGYKVWCKETPDEKPPATTKLTVQVTREVAALYGFGDPKAFTRCRRKGIADTKVYTQFSKEGLVKDLFTTPEEKEEG